MISPQAIQELIDSLYVERNRLLAINADLLDALERIASGVEDGESFSGSYCREIAQTALEKVRA